MSVPAFLEHSYNSACPGCGLAGWQHEKGCAYDAPIVGYTCCYCGGTFDATATDMADARACVAEIAEDEGNPAINAMDDAEAFKQFGRDVCDLCIPQFRAEQEAARATHSAGGVR